MTTAVIVGAGVAGLTLASALRRSGLEVDVCERAPRLRAEGGALLMWSNAVRALASIDLDTDVAAVSAVVERTEFRSWDGTELWTLPVGDLAAAAGPPTLLVSRTELLRVLAMAAGRVEYGRRFVGFSEADDGVDVFFDDGSRRRADLLVGADGLFSTVRQQLLGMETTRSVDQVAWVGLVAADDWPAHGTTVATVGDGHRFWAGRLPDERVYWYATLPDPPTGQPRAKHEVEAAFADCHEPVADLIRRTAPEDCVRTPIHDRRPTGEWGRGRVTLVGDAAHPCTPDLGQGACQGIESAVALATAVHGLGAIPDALRRYEASRRVRTRRVTRLSRATAKLGAAEGVLAGRLRDIGVRVLLPAIALPQIRWLLGVDSTDLDLDERVPGLQVSDEDAPAVDTRGLW